MNKNLQQIQRTLRDTGLLLSVEKIRYVVSLVKCYWKNCKFTTKYPDFSLPPKYLAYDAYSAPDWEFYKKSGEETAAFLVGVIKRYLAGSQSVRVLEWGCGPARVIRHLRPLLGSVDDIIGSDYNPESISWCKNNISGVTFLENKLQPPLTLDDDSIDFIYSISVFTHLSETVSFEWSEELFRVVRPGGVLVITTNGDSLLDMMLPDELTAYNENGYVIRGKYEEGKKMFFSCHSPAYLRHNLFKNFEVLEHIGAGFPYTGQDLWILKKPL